MPANYYSDEDADDVLSLQSRASKRRTASMSRNRRIMGDTISAEEFKDVFKLFDQTQDGLIGTDELYVVFRNFNFSFTHRQIDRLIASGDKDGNGTLDVEEFISLMKQRVDNKGLPRQNWVDDLKEAFEEIDRDNTGTISAEELAHTMKALGEDISKEDISFVMEQIDIDGSGTIDWAEFQSLMDSGDKTVTSSRSPKKDTPKKKKKKKKKRRKRTSDSE